MQSAPRHGTRARIIDAAAELYLAHGDADTTVDEIAAAARLSPSAVYRHFGGKRELEEAMVDEALSRVEGYLAEARQVTSPIERVRGAGAAYFRIAVEFPVALRFFAARSLRGERSGRSDRFDAAVTARTQEMAISVAADLRQAMDVGEIPPGRVTDALVLLWGAWSGVIALMLRRDELAVDVDAAARALDLAQFGIALAVAHQRKDPGLVPPPVLQEGGWTRISPPPVARQGAA